MKKLLIASAMLFPSLVMANGADIVASKNCASCHGANGIAVAPIYPNLAGQQAMYVEAALKAYRDNARGGQFGAIMTANAVGLTDDEIKQIAAYYSELK
ncbi:cytochrome c [Alginatibacterium sediminis]|uniref:Cytochrome c n=1 Tax=Alginatibacterium sediminis TaxID=2164068 RepID=A0A420E9K0_9ALTE|nr:c-type cytochrome [Alginatibacterium sediminis]RKF15792.1 cytochrome c [Alginatibacterium sediminis]